MARKINFNYLNRDYETIKNDLMAYVKVYYPDQYNDFSESSVGMMLLELNAYVGDILSYHVDQSFNEMFMDSAKNRDSVIRIAKNLGYKARGKSPAATLLDVSIEVPTLGDGYDENYMITIQKGMVCKSSNGVKFEVIDDIDFSSHVSLTGVINRTIDPVYNSDNEIVNYLITKTVPAVAGETKVKTLEVTSDNSIPFMKWMPDADDVEITEIRDIVSKTDRFPPETEAEWTDEGTNTYWYQVDSLPQERVFVDNNTTGGTGAEGYWKYVEKRYETDYDKDGNAYVTFGAGIEDYNSYADFLANGASALTVTTILNNDSYGEIPSIGNYLHMRYRSGGGAKTNQSVNSIRTVESKVVSYIPGGAALPAGKVSAVVNSISCNNPIPAIGGAEFQTIDEIKSSARKHFSSQDRCVTIDDYTSRVTLMPASYGKVFRSWAEADPDSMSTKLHILTRDENGKLKNSGNDQIKFNLASYLKNYKVLNDFVSIVDGRIINLGIKFAVQVGKEHNKKDVIVSCIKELTNYFAVENWQMNSVIYISEVTELLMEQPGVVNVAQLDFYNKAGGNYSTDVIAYGVQNNLTMVQQLAANGEVVIEPINNKILSSPTSMFEIKYPDVDIRGAAL